MQIRNTVVILSFAGLLAVPSMSVSAHPSSSKVSHEPILQRPIANVKNNYWFDYLSDIREADHELRKDLARATDEEDRRDAKAEYRAEIADANKDYRKEMRERGYPVGRVDIIGN